MPADELKTVPDPKSIADLNALLPSPGEDGYIFFQNAGQHPYNTTLDFSLVNAHWMIDMSYLAYGVKSEYVLDQLKAIGLNPALFGWDSDLPPHILVAHDKNLIVIAFRGTRIQDLADVLADAAFLPSLTAHGSVHQGFQHALLYGGVWDQAKHHLGDVTGDQVIFFTGHSLGAALATLARRMYRDPFGRQNALYTFGSPRVGDAFIYCTDYPSHTYRIVNDQDAIPHVPTPPWYGHVGTPLSTDGSPLRSSLWQTLETQFADVAAALAVSSLAARVERLRDSLARQNCKALGDHAPKSYGSKIWNSLVSTPMKAAH